MSAVDEHRYGIQDLEKFALALFSAAGLEPDKAEAVATYLVRADLMGHSTHGLALAGWYLDKIEKGVIRKSGAVDVVSDRPAAVAWRGKRLPGAWLTAQAVKLASERSREVGTCTVAIADSGHIGALAAYLVDATSQGLLVQVASSSPSGSQVAPFGGTRGVYTPDPVAYGIPTPDEPILIDISASITTNNMAQRLIREGRRYPAKWLMEADGTPTDDPDALNRGGTLLPTGGLDHGQKGYGMALWVEALTQGLAGYGRADAPEGTNAAVTVQVWDPAAFGGRAAFLRQTGWLADACRRNPPRPGIGRVRLPGEAATASMRDAAERGVVLHPGIVDGLARRASGLAISLPIPLRP
ncbi:Ldh family oxidoreductase [Tropicimonas sp.]|uniref:Ldh family oxidoreductase n=1 Tax=Tropicimonas sp. TaxID=2067044 RepID=UPI003A8A5ACE